MTDIIQFVYEPLDYKKKLGYSVSPEDCRARVHADLWDGYQCTRKPIETIEGYGFCKQHAKKIREWLSRHQEAPHD